MDQKQATLPAELPRWQVLFSAVDSAFYAGLARQHSSIPFFCHGYRSATGHRGEDDEKAMSLTAAGITFRNPLTDITYRLIQADDHWRITRSRVTTAGGIHLAHLRGRSGTGAVAPALIALLVRGQSCRTDDAVDGERTFAAVVIRDLDATVDYLAALAANTEEVLERGRPGFRAGSPALRQRRDTARREVADGARTLISAWAASGLVGESLPAWLTSTPPHPKYTMPPGAH